MVKKMKRQTIPPPPIDYDDNDTFIDENGEEVDMNIEKYRD